MCCINTRIHKSVLTLLYNAVNSTFIPITANEKHSNQQCVYREGTCSGFIRQMSIMAPVWTQLTSNRVVQHDDRPSLKLDLEGFDICTYLLIICSGQDCGISGLYYYCSSGLDMSPTEACSISEQQLHSQYFHYGQRTCLTMSPNYT